MNKIKLIISILIIILIVIFSIIYINHYTTPKEINIKTQGVIFRLGDENQFIEKAEIELVGEVKRYLFEGPLFTGKIKFNGDVLHDKSFGISFNGINVMDNSYDIFSFLLKKDTMSNGYRGNVNSDYYNSNVQKPLNISSIHINKEFDKLCLIIAELHSKSENSTSYTWGTDTGLVFASPASTRDEALEITKYFIETPGIGPLK